jgi:hypothetical protein
LNPYEPGNRPRCIVCLKELDPAHTRQIAGEGPRYSGFLPCPDHPKAAAIYKNEVTGSPTSPAIAVTPFLSVGASSKLHHLKTWPRWFVPAWAGLKPFEVRKNDRGFMAGDGIILEEWDSERKCLSGGAKDGPCKDVCICRYTGRQIQGRITYVILGGDMSGLPGAGVKGSWCVFGYKEISRTVSP